jgi:hypothetical protein
MFGRFRVCMRVLALVALSTSVLAPPLRAEPTTKTHNLTPLDYPLSPSAQSALPPPRLPQPRPPGTPPQVIAPQPSKQPGPPPPLLGNAPPATPQAPPTQSLKDWRAGMAKVPLPKKGCFTSSYPGTEWQEVPCKTAPAIPFPPARGPRPNTVGNGNDVSAQVTGQISTAVGSFDSVTGVTSESGTMGGANAFSLQLNSNFFNTSVCNGATNPSQCLGWQQFVYSNVEDPHLAFMQYWLINFGTCPTTGGPEATGWIQSGNDCFGNSNAVSVPAQTIANLGNLSLLGAANSGGMDTFIMATGSDLYSVQNEDNVVNLAQGWQEAEFNVFGDAGGSQANFNSGSTIVVRTSVDSGTVSAPSCYGGGGFTAETNNLSFASAPSAKLGTSPAIVFTESSAGTASACASATSVASGETTDTHDFNGDGNSDILWRDTSGDVAMWLMNGTQVLQSAVLGNVSTTWSIAGQRDFYGIGKSGILWRDTSGNVAIWQMNGSTVTLSTILGNIPTTWSIAGTGFNSNGMGDILWRDTSGNVAIWLMNGAAVSSSTFVGNVPTTWSIAGTGDFNGDGQTDILWRDTSGNVAIWLMNGAQVPSSTFVGNVATTWSIVGTGDFNGGGKSDILWHDTSGNVAIWLMNGAAVSSSAFVGNVATVWSIADTGDYNGDGKSDILWRDTSGNVVIWLMNGAAVSSSAFVGNVSTVWTIQTANVD